jgi:xanthine dehydrogenase accessory factor
MTTNFRTLVAAYRALKNAQLPLVLATVVETLGSTYRKAGARVLITEHGQFHGIIGGGCFQGDLLHRARQMFGDATPRFIFYDMRAQHDEVWGLGLGCNGAMRLLLERLDPAYEFDPLATMERCLSRRARGVLATICAPNAIDGLAHRHIFIEENGHSLRHPAWLVELAEKVSVIKAPLLTEHRVERGAITVFCDWLQPPPHLLIVGAGADAVPLVGLARLMDWEITVVDHREAYADRQRFVAADRVLTVTPEALTDRVEMGAVDAAILMTHNIAYDERFLRALAGTAVGYIGLLGPAARRDRLLAKLGGAALSLRNRLSGPVGLDIGARLPEEIALAIIAELVAHFRDRESFARRKSGVHQMLAAGRVARKPTQANVELRSHFMNDHKTAACENA